MHIDRMMTIQQSVLLRHVPGLIVGLSLLFYVSASMADGGQPRLPIIDLGVGSHTLKVEVASTANQRYNGLSYRTELGDDEGMLFVYQRPRMLTFTMRNTVLPLSIAYITEDLVIDEILDMDVGPNQFFPSRSTVKYALEVNQGWFEKHDIAAGDRVKLR